MYPVLRIAHFLGLALFLGSIAVYIVMGTPLNDAALTLYARETVHTSVRFLTVPGVTLLLVTGVAMAFTNRRLLRTPFFKVKLGLGAVVFANTLFIASQVAAAAEHARNLPAAQALLESALTKEAIFGGVNVLLALFLVSFSVIRFRGRRTAG